MNPKLKRNTLRFGSTTLKYGDLRDLLLPFVPCLLDADHISEDEH